MQPRAPCRTGEGVGRRRVGARRRAGVRGKTFGGHGPILEEDSGLANVGLHLLGQGRLWLSYAGEVEGRNRSEDELAFLRDGTAFRNLQLAELPNGDFATTMARQFYFDHAHLLLL